MANILKFPRATPTLAPKFIQLPHMAGVQGIFLMGQSLAQSQKNLVLGGADATIVGSPVVHDFGLDFTGNGIAYMQTAIADSQDLTLIAIARALTDTNASLISNYQSASQSHSGATIGAALQLHLGAASGDGTVRAEFTRALDVSGVTTNATALAAPEFAVGQTGVIVGRLDHATRIRRANNLTTGAVGTNTPSGTTLDLGQTFRIGSAYNSQYAGQVRIFAAILANVAQTDAEIAENIAFLAPMCAARGETILAA